MATEFTPARHIEDVPTIEEWDFYLIEAVDNLLMEGVAPEGEALEAEIMRLADLDLLVEDGDFGFDFGIVYDDEMELEEFWLRGDEHRFLGIAKSKW